MQSTVPPAWRQLQVATPGHRYDVLIGAGLLHDARAWAGLPRGRSAVIVTQPQVHALYGAAVAAALAPLHEQVSTVLLPDGEQHKNWDSLNLIFDHLLARACDRQTLLVALGGGVVGDITGFAAATYQRGVRFVQVPTTLLAQVDSSVGGKTAINHPRGKNMIGAFHQPERVLCDLQTLATLPARELRAGLAEVIKYAPIADLALLDWLEGALPALLLGDTDALAHAVHRSCQIKAEVVGQDERESGLRAILNFGHTFGHAIEAGMGYGHWLHGEAVGCGMVLAADLSAELGLIDASFARRLKNLIAAAGLPVQAPPIPLARWFELMQLDKKSAAGDIRFVVIGPPGQATLRTAPRERVERVIQRHSAAPGTPQEPAAA